MTTPVLMYHDVTPAGRDDASGFPGGDAGRYKLTPERFERHLDAIAAQLSFPPALTFDDGGLSASVIAEALELREWRGFFFVTTGYIGRAGFLDAAGIRALHAAGHIIGSHSHSHPLRMGACSNCRLREEWSRSVNLLSDLLGEPVRVASVPGGHYSDRVAHAAAGAGLTTLFTSTPTTRRRHVNGVEVIGRYAIYGSTSPSIAAAIAAGHLLPRAAWAALWSIKRIGKAVGPAIYLKLRAHLLGADEDMRWGDELGTLSEDPS